MELIYAKLRVVDLSDDNFRPAPLISKNILGIKTAELTEVVTLSCRQLLSRDKLIIRKNNPFHNISEHYFIYIKLRQTEVVGVPLFHLRLKLPIFYEFKSCDTLTGIL